MKSELSRLSLIEPRNDGTAQVLSRGGGGGVFSLQIAFHGEVQRNQLTFSLEFEEGNSLSLNPLMIYSHDFYFYFPGLFSANNFFFNFFFFVCVNHFFLICGRENGAETKWCSQFH